eukprot:1481943-Rhodomonas_salina.2
MRKRQGRTDNLFVFDDGQGSGYCGCEDCLTLSVGTMLWHWRLRPKRAIHYSQVCKACTTSTDPQENVANARMQGRVRRMTAPPSADLKARPSRAGWVPSASRCVQVLNCSYFNLLKWCWETV